jgi:glycosyltransferase involved in cell wall biosynthesis
VIAYVAAAVAALPWVLIPWLAIARAKRSRTLAEERDTPPSPAPHVSIVVPARDERRNIARCVRGLLSSTYPDFDVIVVDDHSSDGTGEIARAIAASDARLRVLESPALPDGWFGKQWACATGASVARGELLCFTDADTEHASELLTRAVNALRSRPADLLSVAGVQELSSFWERVVQPQIFFVLVMRYGSTEAVGAAKRAEDVIANGQFLLVRRDAYDAVGGHTAVRDKVAEDLALGQKFFRAGNRVAMVLAPQYLTTHMYASLAELVRGWRKNVYAGGRDAVPRQARLLIPFALLLPPLAALAPVVSLALALAGVVTGAWLLWSAVSVAATVFWWLVLYGYVREPRWYAFLYPVGALVVLYIMIGALARGDRVSWKGRRYRSA